MTNYSLTTVIFKKLLDIGELKLIFFFILKK